MDLGGKPRLLRGAHGWLWGQPTCHSEVPTSYHRDKSAASEQSGALEQLRKSKEKEEEEEEEEEGQQP